MMAKYDQPVAIPGQPGAPLASIAGLELNVWECKKIQSYGYAAALHIMECDSAAVALDFRPS